MPGTRCWVRATILLGMVLAVSNARAQDAALPPPVEATPAPPAPPPPAEGEFSPYQPPPPSAAPAPAAQAAPTAPPSPGQPAPTPEITVTPLEQPAPPPAVAAPPAAKAQDTCKETGTGKGFFRGSIPVWAAGAVAGGAVGALGLSLVGLGIAAVINVALVRAWIPAPPSGLPGIYALPLVALPLGAVMGAVVGGLVAPFLPMMVFTKPCLKEPGSDPTLRPSGQGSGSPGTGTAG